MTRAVGLEEKRPGEDEKMADDADGHALGAQLIERCHEAGIILDGLEVVLHVAGEVCHVMGDDGTPRLDSVDHPSDPESITDPLCGNQHLSIITIGNY